MSWTAPPISLQSGALLALARPGAQALSFTAGIPAGRRLPRRSQERAAAEQMRSRCARHRTVPRHYGRDLPLEIGPVIRSKAGGIHPRPRSGAVGNVEQGVNSQQFLRQPGNLPGQRLSKYALAPHLLLDFSQRQNCFEWPRHTESRNWYLYVFRRKPLTGGATSRALA